MVPTSPPQHRRRLGRRSTFAALVALPLVLLSGCADSTSTTAPTSSSDVTVMNTVPISASSTSTTSTSPVDSMRGDRYCEVLIVTPVDGNIKAKVYNSWPLNTCPDDLFTALDPATIATEYGAPLALLNGPRYWLMDSIEKTDTSEMTTASFGGIDMYLQATVDVGPMSDAMTPYKTHAVDRSAVFTYNAGQTVYELTAPTGETYVMQTWSQTVDPTLEEADLADLARRLTPPAGWMYSSRTLTSPLRVATGEEAAQVLQDDLQNSYSLVTD